MDSRVTAIILLIIVMIIWGSSFAITKISLSEVPPVLFALLRFVFASVLLIGFVRMRKGGFVKPLRSVPWGIVTLMGLSGVCLYYIAFNYSLLYTSASQGALIQSFIPVVTAFLAVFFLKESLSARRFFGIAISIGGIFLILAFAGGGSENSQDSMLGNLIMFGAVGIWAFYTILAKRLAHIDPLVVTAFSTLIGTLLLIPATLFELYGKSIPSISTAGWLSIIYLGGVSSAGGMLLYNRSLQYLDASQTTNFLNLMPIIAVVTAVFFLGESLTPWQLGGGLLVLLGVWISMQTRPIQQIELLDNSLEATVS